MICQVCYSRSSEKQKSNSDETCKDFIRGNARVSEIGGSQKKNGRAIRPSGTQTRN